MTYIPDGEDRDYAVKEDDWDAYIEEGAVEERPTFFAFGWLDSDYEFNTGWEHYKLKNMVLRRLDSKEVVDRFMGFHSDEELGLSHLSSHVEPNGSLKFEYEDVTYVAPNAVKHYILELDYRPPDKAIDAILGGRKMWERFLNRKKKEEKESKETSLASEHLILSQDELDNFNPH